MLLALLADEEGIVVQGLREFDLESGQMVEILKGGTYKLRRYPRAQVLEMAAQEANRTGWDRIETPHLFVALTTLEYGCTRRALWQQNAYPDIVTELMRAALAQMVGSGEPGTAVTSSEASIGPRAREVLELAEKEAQQRGRPEASDFEIIQSILMRGSSQTAKLLQSMGVDPAQVMAYAETLNQPRQEP